MKFIVPKRVDFSYRIVKNNPFADDILRG